MSEVLTLPVILAGIIVISLNAYVLLAGADFGGGVWDFFASGARKSDQRALIASAIGPVWEANHVWLILVIVLLFTCFPMVFAALSIALHIPLIVMLVGIVLRGAAFTFRSYDSQRDEVQRRWGRVFAIASLVTPVILGVCVGAIASGRILPDVMTGFPEGSFADAFVRPWLTAFGLAVGAMTLALFALLAAVYLTVEATTPGLRDDFRQRALVAQGCVVAASLIAGGLAWSGAPVLREEISRGWGAAAVMVAVAAAVTATVWLLRERRYGLARVAAAAQVSMILWGWPLAQFPYLLPPHTTIAQAAGPTSTLRLVLWTLVVGALVLFPSLLYLFRVFKSSAERPANT